ncbi:MAG: 50S ribosomal protein L4 [Candidatus Lambdaproteobacteria bacterium RIFOXYD12_FULL_49_8]|uniref:Large ribosomal subunit protein uL4 n=1 Tax=Candidatus Lambdaproteobacteria bacterium RIFOXYD2_FULL_50_16 TaxID=1817772 RepID=A0A1F6G6F7_9PROT|nr:MAG: 50S ribosomal protein L4 [Candidatus Lambdaproteobacteria bacterium RIFOXYD2_FULL_50_16]OGG96392.1 MAG: 50S ribosomal protein L4 [Candidatus Lambdaproteobacteria bacterium RIFOXYD12_FULL_49_8]
MAVINVVNLKNQDAGNLEIADQVAQAPLNPFVIKDAVVEVLAKQRSGNHKVKTRAEVAGSTRKLFRQKGTGNARQGDVKAPHRRHGGIVFGPVVRDHSIKINKQVKKKALCSVISEKIRQGKLVVVDNLKLDGPKTKDLTRILDAMKITKALVVFKEEDRNFTLASRNLQQLTVTHLSGLNVYEALRHDQLVVTKDAMKDIEGRLLK